MRCPSCRKKVNKEDGICFNCGYPISLGNNHDPDDYTKEYNEISRVDKHERTSQAENQQGQRATIQKTIMTNNQKNSTHKSKQRSVKPFMIFVMAFIIFSLVRWVTSANYEEESIDRIYEYTSFDSETLDQEDVFEDEDFKAYFYEDSLGSPWMFFEVKNNSDYDLNLVMKLTTYDKNGSILNAKTGYRAAFEQDTVTLIPFLLDEMPEAYEYELVLEEEVTFNCVISDLEVEYHSSGGQEIVSITNTGRHNAMYVDAMVLFMKDGEVVYYRSQYFADDDLELKAHETITQEFKCYQEYDEIKVYLTGRR